jgi:hypothetical protein
MHRSFWELEVYAKDYQQRRWAEAARQGCADEAMSVEAVSINLFTLGIAQFVSKIRAWLSTRRTPRVTQLDEPKWLVSNVQTAVIRTDFQRTPRTRPRRLPQPYADMVVIARSPSQKEWSNVVVSEIADSERRAELVALDIGDVKTFWSAVAEKEDTS